MKGLTLRAGVYNIFNKTYYDALNVASTEPDPAARILFGARANLQADADAKF